MPNPGRDFITEANNLNDVDALRLLWTEAQAAGADKKTLDEVKTRAERLSGAEGKLSGDSSGVPRSGKKK